MNPVSHKYFFAFLLSLFCFPRFAIRAGVVTSCDEAGLRSAMAGGGNVTFTCEGTITLTNTLSITNDTVFDAIGHNVILSGGNTVRLLNVSTGVVFTAKNLILANGRMTGTNGAQNQMGGDAAAGAILNFGTVNLSNCTLTNHTALGGNAGFVFNSYRRGGEASAGAILNYGSLSITNCLFVKTTAQGGTGASSFADNGPGGAARGGAIMNQGGTVNIYSSLFSNNIAAGGLAGSTPSGDTAPRGAGEGGAIYSLGGIVQAWNSSFLSNAVTGLPVNGGAIFASNACNLAVILTNVVCANNTATGFIPSGLASQSGAPSGGGGIFCFGSARLFQSSVFSNSVVRGNPSRGGGIFCSCTLELNSSSVYGNQAVGSIGLKNNPRTIHPAGEGVGGGISAGDLTATNCTIVGNLAQGGNGQFTNTFGGVSAANGVGGGIYGSVNLTHVTLANNRASGGTGSATNGVAIGGGFNSTSGVLRASLLSSNSPNNTASLVVDNGYNLSTDGSGNFNSGTSLANVDSKVGPLGNYGGPTATMPLLIGSPAIDGAGTGCPSTDQRGHTRPFGAACDIGAFESSPPYLIRGQVSGYTLADEMTIIAGSTTTVTTHRGSYSLEGLAPNAYAVTPSHPNYLFVPSNRSLTIGPDQLNIDFKAYRWNALSIEGVSNGMLHLAYASTNGPTHRVLVSSNLIDWIAISTNTTGPSNLFDVFDPMQPSRRFYRAQSP